MGLFTKKIGTVFIKETSDAAQFIEKMKMLQLQNEEPEMTKKIEKQIKLAQYGEVGENNIAFELKNSGMDMYVLHDIYLEVGSLSAQIDYIVITRKHIYVIECKNLIGNIEVDNTGAFIRTYEMSGRKIKEGVYSPITQNQRHLQVIKEIRKNSKSNIITKMLFERCFDTTYKAIVVLANPKTYLNAKFAPKELREQIIRADRLITYIKEKDELSKDSDMSNENMLEIAQFFLEQNIPERSDYSRKYAELIQERKLSDLKEEQGVQREQNIECVKEDKNSSPKTDREEIVRRLKDFRLSQSRKENVKAYYIFNDAQMNDLVEKYPKNKDELLKVSGFGNIKVEKYGDEILRILQEG